MIARHQLRWAPAEAERCRSTCSGFFDEGGDLPTGGRVGMRMSSVWGASRDFHSFPVSPAGSHC